MMANTHKSVIGVGWAIIPYYWVLWWMAVLPFACQSLTLNNLSPIESAVFQSRLERIESATEDKYSKFLVDEINNSRCSTFIFPGAGGVDVLVEELCAKIPNSIIIDWSEHRGSILTAAYDGEAVGQAIANLLLRQQQQGSSQEEIHFIGISVGAFCANAAATVLYQQRQQDSTQSVRLTLLDPFCGRGVLGGSYGNDNFGKYATTAIQILNSDDPVPSTNDPLPNCFCLDVTNAPERDSFVPLPGDSMHSWPLAYFARHFQEPSGPLERGTVVKIAS
jgi:hypothetical protein